MNINEHIEAKPTGSSGKIWGLWQGDEVIADAMHQNDAEHFAALHNARVKTEAETFQAHGLTWVKHTPGGPMPCGESVSVRVLLNYDKHGDYWPVVEPAFAWDWSKNTEEDNQIIGWNYADAP